MSVVDAAMASDHRRANSIQTLLLLGALALILMALGYLFLGAWGVVGAVGLGSFWLWFSPRVAPAMIMRLYRAKPVDPRSLPEVHQVVEELAARAGLPRAPALYYVGSKMMNAFTVGDPSRAAIGVTDGILRGLTLRELTGVIAHEMSHVQHDDMRVMTTADMVSRVTSFLSNVGQILIIINLPLIVMGKGSFSWFTILLLLAAPTLTALLQLALSRTREFDADLGAVELTRDPVGLASALQKLERHQRGFLSAVLIPGGRSPDPSLLRTHPATAERIERLMAYAGRRVDHRAGQAVPLPASRFIVPESMLVPHRGPRWHMSGLWY